VIIANWRRDHEFVIIDTANPILWPLDDLSRPEYHNKYDGDAWLGYDSKSLMGDLVKGP